MGEGNWIEAAQRARTTSIARKSTAGTRKTTGREIGTTVAIAIFKHRIWMGGGLGKGAVAGFLRRERSQA
jgi:hypothetical protein